jgi:hypothetical protein
MILSYKNIIRFNQSHNNKGFRAFEEYAMGSDFKNVIDFCQKLKDEYFTYNENLVINLPYKDRVTDIVLTQDNILPKLSQYVFTDHNIICSMHNSIFITIRAPLIFSKSRSEHISSHLRCENLTGLSYINLSSFEDKHNHIELLTNSLPINVTKSDKINNIPHYTLFDFKNKELSDLIITEYSNNFAFYDGLIALYRLFILCSLDELLELKVILMSELNFSLSDFDNINYYEAIQLYKKYIEIKTKQNNPNE